MTELDVTAELLHHLVAGSHAEGVTALAVSATIDHDDRVLLVVEPGADFIDDTWQLPTSPVLPGETLTDALPKTLATAGLTIDEVTSYLGHQDRTDTDGELTRVFCFAVTVTDPDSVCRSSHTRHWWADRADLGDLPPPAAPTPRAPRIRAEKTWPPLTAALRANARGLPAVEAATELLIHHATWLHRHDFRDRFLHLTVSVTGDSEMADIAWSTAITALNAGELPCSSGEARILRLAASLADGQPVDLRDCLTGLDTRNTDLVSQVAWHAAGHPPATNPRLRDRQLFDFE